MAKKISLDQIKTSEDAILVFYRQLIHYRKWRSSHYFYESGVEERLAALKNNFQRIIEQISIEKSEEEINALVVNLTEVKENKFTIPTRKISYKINVFLTDAIQEKAKKIYLYFDPYFVLSKSDAGMLGKKILDTINKEIKNTRTIEQSLATIYLYCCDRRNLSSINNYDMRKAKKALELLIRRFEMAIARQAELDGNNETKNLFGFIVLRKLGSKENFDANVNYYEKFQTDYREAIQNKYNAINAIKGVETVPTVAHIDSLRTANEQIDKIHSTLRETNPNIFKETQYGDDQLEFKIIGQLENYLIEAKEGKHDEFRKSQVSTFFTNVSPKVAERKNACLNEVATALKEVKQSLFNEDKEYAERITPHAGNSKLNQLVTEGIEQVYFKRNVKDIYKAAKRLDKTWISWLTRLFEKLKLFVNAEEERTLGHCAP